MADTTDLGQPNTETASAETPAETSTFDPKAFQEGLASEFEKRFRGIQSLTDRQLGELKNTIEELRAANLTPEEQEQLEVKQARDRTSVLERENALLKMRKQYPEEVDFLEAFFGAKSLDEQLTALSGFRKTPAAAAAEEPAPRSTSTPVSGNNAPRRATPTMSDAGGSRMTDELADQILNAGNEPGILKRLFGR
jgi:hypothetical protein